MQTELVDGLNVRGGAGSGRRLKDDQKVLSLRNQLSSSASS